MKRVLCRVTLSFVTFLVGLSTTWLFAVHDKIPPVTMQSRRITEITFKHQNCVQASPSCAVYEVTFRSDGTAQYRGNEMDDMPGNHRADIGALRFETLARQVERQDFFALRPEYLSPLGGEQIVTTVVTDQGAKSVTVYSAEKAPEGLWIVNSLLYAEIFAVEWDDEY